MKCRRLSFYAVLWLTLTGTGCAPILGDFTVGAELDGAIDDATLLPEAGAGSALDGRSSPDALGAADGSLRGDAGPVDASAPGVLDGGDDGSAIGSCVPGGTCAPGDCQYGTWVCVDGGRACQATTDVDAGTPCGAGGDAGASVCKGGQCVACSAGGDCSDPSVKCVKKTYDCASGAAVCTVSGNAPDGTTCGPSSAMYCNAGTCGACQVGTSCQPAVNACHAGKVTACVGGVATCTDQGVAAAPGTPCATQGGASGVCDANASCTACTGGAQCNPNNNACQVGVQSCSAGPQCMNPVPVHEGQTCGAGLVCHNGTCAACNAATC